MSREAVFALAEELSEAARQNYADWDGDFFLEVWSRSAWGLIRLLEDEPSEEPVVRAVLGALAEAMGRGYVTRYTLSWDASGGPKNLMSLVFGRLILYGISRIATGERLQLIADLWNLCEGLYQQPGWMDRAVTGTLARTYPDLTQVVPLATECLGELLSPLPNAAWTGVRQTIQLDLSEAADTFLPGEIYRAGPRVVYVQDRRDTTEVALFLAPEGETRIIGEASHVSALSPGRTPRVEVSGGRVKAGGHEAAINFLREPLGTLALDSGFVLTSTRDSQFVWVTEFL